MQIIRVVFLALLVCFHVIGAAALFRRWFPRESPWLGFVIPTLVLLSGLNFFEHFIALPNLGWLLPFTLGGLIWAMLRPGFSWQGLWLPSILFVLAFGFVLLLKSLSPEIPNYTEGTGNMTRVLNYSLGGTLPPVDCFLPPYDYGGYYSFQQYGAAILKRLFFIDLGTAYNLSFAFLLAWTCVVGAGVAHAITGKSWIAAVTVMTLLACPTGSTLFLIFSHHGLDYGIATDINDSWNDKERNPFWWLCSQDAYHPGLKLLPPTYTLYYSEFHANLGGVFLVLVSLLATFHIFKVERSNWPWICLLVLPMMVIITSAWFFFIVLFFCGGGLALALVAGRRPRNWRLVCALGAVGLILLWPTALGILSNPYTQKFYWTPPDGRTALWMFALQWWPVWLPWLFLCFVWDRLDLPCRWIHFSLPVLFLFVEFCTFGDRGLTVEKMWGAVFGAGLVTLLPMLYLQRGLFFRFLTAFMVVSMAICLGGWVKTVYINPTDPTKYFRITGDSFIQDNTQKRRLLQVLKRFHGATILPGKSDWAYNEAPALIGFSENRCYVAYFYQEDQAGHKGESEYRSSLNNQFYAGTMTSPLPFLRSANIAAVLIYPEDAIPDALLQQFQQEIGSEYFYINCKMDGTNNAGVFVRQTDLPVPFPQTAPPPPLDLSPMPPP